MGTAHYIAPEQATGQEAGPASDVYSLGVVGYECLAGQRPFLSDNAVTVAMMHIRDVPPQLPPDVPPGVRALIEATLVKDPRSRYRNGGEFAHAVAAVRAGLPLPAPAGFAAPGPIQPLPLLAGAVPRASGSSPIPVSALDTAPTPAATAYPPARRPQQRVGVWVFVILLLIVALVVSGWVVSRAVTRAAESSQQNVTVSVGGDRACRPSRPGTVRQDPPARCLVAAVGAEEDP